MYLKQWVGALLTEQEVEIRSELRGEIWSALIKPFRFHRRRIFDLARN